MKCKYCQKEYVPPHNRQEYCSLDCRRKNNLLKLKEKTRIRKFLWNSLTEKQQIKLMLKFTEKEMKK